ncbi:MAG TPA: glycerophosphodiester phosphodiesterase [Steroidobacteraceae bacterium]
MTIARAGFDLHGHRGARGLWPENTLAGFSRTMALGVAAMEFDCLVTRDGVIVVTHDAQLNPDCTRDARGRFLESAGPPILALSYEELQSYDVGRLRPGSAYAARFPQQQAVDGERIPKLTDVLDLIRTHGGGRVRASIEVKISPEKPAATLAPEPFVRLLAEAVRSTGMEAFTNILCFDWRVLTAARTQLPQATIVASTDQQPDFDTVRLGAAVPSPWLGGLDPQQIGRSVPQLVKAVGADLWAPDYLDLNAEWVGEAHALGLGVVPWTVNDPTDMRRLLGFGVDGMISDRPDRLRKVLQQQGLALPRPSP